jgi:hypothetical protein
MKSSGSPARRRFEKIFAIIFLDIFLFLITSLASYFINADFIKTNNHHNHAGKPPMKSLSSSCGRGKNKCAVGGGGESSFLLFGAAVYEPTSV